MKKNLLAIALLTTTFFGINVLQSLACFTAAPSDKISDINEYNFFVKDYNRTEAIFLGKVIVIDCFRVKFKINKVWKGDIPSEFVMSTGNFPR